MKPRHMIGKHSVSEVFSILSSWNIIVETGSYKVKKDDFNLEFSYFLLSRR